MKQIKHGRGDYRCNASGAIFLPEINRLCNRSKNGRTFLLWKKSKTLMNTPGSGSVGKRQGKKEAEQNGNQRVKEGRRDDGEVFGVAQNAVFGHNCGQNQQQIDDASDQRPAQAPPFQRREGHILGLHRALMHVHACKAGFQKLVGDEHNQSAAWRNG